MEGSNSKISFIEAMNWSIPISSSGLHWNHAVNSILNDGNLENIDEI